MEVSVQLQSPLLKLFSLWKLCLRLCSISPPSPYRPLLRYKLIVRLRLPITMKTEDSSSVNLVTLLVTKSNFKRVVVSSTSSVISRF